MTIVRTGATQKYSDGWAAAFGGAKGKKKATAAKSTKKAASKKASTKKKAAKKKAKGSK